MPSSVPGAVPLLASGLDGIGRLAVVVEHAEHRCSRSREGSVSCTASQHQRLYRPDRRESIQDGWLEVVDQFRPPALQIVRPYDRAQVGPLICAGLYPPIGRCRGDVNRRHHDYEGKWKSVGFIADRVA